MLISKKMEKALNDQLILESFAHYQYLAMASWSEREGMEGAAAFFYQHAMEENQHMMKIFQFINEVNGFAIVPPVKQPQLEFNGLLNICQSALRHEEKVTRAIHKMVEIAVKENDHVTYDFLRYFVREQREEEVLFGRVIDKINLIGKGSQSSYYIDKELANLSAKSNEEEVVE